MSDTPEPSAGGSGASQPRIEVDASNAVAAYANFCRVGGTPEEVIIDFGLNPQSQGTTAEPINITQRVVMNYYTAKRLLHVLHMTIGQHERAFGVLETDIRKRVVAQPTSEDGEK